MSMSGFDPEDFIPANQSAFRVYQVAKIFHCSTQHIFKLITEGEIVVPQERIDSALSRACILIPRDSLVDFLRRRSSVEWFKKFEKRNKKVAPEGNTPARMTRKRKGLPNARLKASQGR
jgi:hypothetical protein